MMYGARHPPSGAGESDPWDQLLETVTCRVLSAGWYSLPAGWEFTDRLRPNAIAYVFVEGSAWVSDREKTHRRKLTAGDVLLMPPDRSHSMRIDPGAGADLYTLHFLAQIYGGLDAISLLGFPAALRPPASRLSSTIERFRYIIAEFDEASAACRLAANGACAGIVSLLWRDTIRDRPGTAVAAGTGVQGLARLAPAFREIHADYAHPLTLRELADTVHLSPAHFSTVFKRATGVSPLRYVANYRIRQVRHLLVTSNQSIAEIAATTGFRDPFYLSRVFKRIEGTSPRDYRRTQESADLP